MSDDFLHIALAFAGGLFGAGGVYMWMKMSITELRKDLSGIGSKVGSNEKAAARRYYNMSQALQFATPDDKKKDVISILREF